MEYFKLTQKGAFSVSDCANVIFNGGTMEHP